jgi:hypothetical protein
VNALCVNKVAGALSLTDTASLPAAEILAAK